MGRAALAYAARGIPVLPLHYPVTQAVRSSESGCSCLRPACGSPGKHPLADLVPHGVADASTDPTRLASWWARYPNANIGLATGHQFDVLDVDGLVGAITMRRLATEHDLTSTGPVVRTGSGGWHFYYAPTGLGNPSPRGLDHVDWRGRGGYVVAPPSLHRSASRYAFARDLSAPLPAVPAALRALLEAVPTKDPAGRVLVGAPGVSGHPYGRTALQAECEQLRATPPGGRNRRLYLAGLRLHSLAAGGVLNPAEIDARLAAAARTAGLTDRETNATLRSARQIAAEHPRGVPDRPLPRSGGRARTARAQRGQQQGRAEEADRER